MKTYKWIIIIVNLCLLLGYFNYSVYQKEEIINNGKLILLELAPRDPRSLIQGDYMNLNYSISRNPKTDLKRGFCVVKIDSNGVAQKQRFQKNRLPVGKDEYLIEFTSKNRWNLNIGTESYFFQEGKAEKYVSAKYGGLKIDKQGNSVLVGLYNSDKIKI